MSTTVHPVARAATAAPASTSLASSIVAPRAARTGRRLPIQVPRWALPLLKPCRIKGLKGGRGGGKSHTAIELTLLEFVKNPNFKVVFIREVQKSIKDSVYQLVKDKIESLKLSKYFVITTTEIRSSKGSGKMIFIGMMDHTAAHVKSLEGADRAVVEEAQTISRHSIKTLMPTIRKEGAEVWLLWNPKRKTDAVDEYFATLLPGEFILIEVSYLQNRHASQTLIAEAEKCKRNDPDEYRHIYGGGYEIHSSATIFKKLFTKETFEFPKGVVRRFGVDWGFTDALVMISGWAEFGEDGTPGDLYIRHEAYESGVELSETKAHFLTVPESLRWPITAGRDRPERIRDGRKDGFKMTACVGGNNSEQEGVEYLKKFVIHIHKDCPKTAADFEGYLHPVDRHTGKVLTDQLPTVKNHGVEAARMMTEPLRIYEREQKDAGPPVDPTPIPVKHYWREKRG